MKNIKRMFIIFFIFSLVYLYVPLTASQPGDADDPLVTRSFVENKIAQLQIEISMIRGAISGVNPDVFQEIPQPTQPTQTQQPAFVEREVFEVLNFQAGQIITFEASAEFILRSGNAAAVTGVNGILDITAGQDILNGELISLHHMMMVPVTDGRGILFHTDAWIMVRGGYSIVN